jgi:VanZ family protein
LCLAPARSASIYGFLLLRIYPLVKHNLTLWALFILALAVLCWGLFRSQPPAELFEQSDKYQHAVAFALVVFLGSLVVTGRRRWIYWVAWLLMAAVLEYLQGLWLPGRTFDQGDILANYVGVLAAFLAWGLVCLLRRKSAASIGL